MPETAAASSFDSIDASAMVRGVVIAAAAVAVAMLVHQIGYRIARKLVNRLGSPAGQSLVKRSSRPAAFILPTIALQLVVPMLLLSPRAAEIAGHVISIALIAGLTWLLTRLTFVVSDVVDRRYPINVADNRRARRITTLVRIMRQVASVVLIVVGAAVALMTFPQARQLGASVLASAGIAGLAIGMAARPALGNIIAGVQIALTEPIALDDVVIIEGEFGRIEEITTTYVVVCVWDQRRIIVPLSHVIEKPFQNWTRVTSDLLGTVLVHTDFTVRVEAVREELTRILTTGTRWDKRVNVVHVTDATSGRLELRLLMSAADASTLWDLRCEVREGIVEFLRREYGHTLQRTRVELLGPPRSGIDAVQTRPPDGAVSR